MSDLLDRDHAAAEHHRLQVQPPAGREHARRAREHVAVDRVLAPGAELLGRAEVLEGAEAGDRVERPEALARQLAGVEQPHVEPVPPARRRLCARERHAQRRPAAAAHEVEQRAPAAAEVEHPPPGPDPDLLGDVLVLAPLRLLEADREVAVVLRAAEVRELAEAEPEDAVGQRVGEVELRPIGHGLTVFAPPAGAVRRPAGDSRSLSARGSRASRSSADPTRASAAARHGSRSSRPSWSSAGRSRRSARSRRGRP